MTGHLFTSLVEDWAANNSSPTCSCHSRYLQSPPKVCLEKQFPRCKMCAAVLWGRTTDELSGATCSWMSPVAVVFTVGSAASRYAWYGSESAGCSGTRSNPWWSCRRPPGGSAAEFSGSTEPSLRTCAPQRDHNLDSGVELCKSPRQRQTRSALENRRENFMVCRAAPKSRRDVMPRQNVNGRGRRGRQG